MALAYGLNHRESERDVAAAAAPWPDADLAGGSSSRPAPAMLTGWPDGTATFNRTAAQRLLIRIYMQVVEQQRALSWPGGLAPTEHGGGLNAPKCFQAAGTPNEFPPVQAQAGPPG